MGSHTYADICHNVARLGGQVTFADEPVNKRRDPEWQLEIIVDCETSAVSPIGLDWWQVWKNSPRVCGKKAEIPADLSFVLISEYQCYGVHLINESPDAAGGDEDWTCVGMTPEDFESLLKSARTDSSRAPDDILESRFAGAKESVVKFLRDFGLAAEIEDESVVQWTG